MSLDIEKQFKYLPEIPADEVALKEAGRRLKTNVEAWSSYNFQEIAEDIFLFDTMGRATVPAALDTWRKIGQYPPFQFEMKNELNCTISNGENERVLKLIRVAFLMGMMSEQPRGRLRFWGAPKKAVLNFGYHEQLFEKHKTELEAKQAAAATQAATATATAPSTAPAIRIDWDPDNLSGKNKEYNDAWKEAERKWQMIPNLPTGNTPIDILDRFNAGMLLIHDYLWGSAYRIGYSPKVRATMDFLLPRIFPDITTIPDLITIFFKDPTFNSTKSGMPIPQGINDLPPIAQALFIPENLRGTPLNDVLQKNVRNLRTRMLNTLHPDILNADPDTSQNLRDYAEVINQTINDSWATIKPLFQ